jgi:hypothetical protein
MGKCCGGKNAGLPISVPRYVAGLGVFCTYHTAVHVLLRAAARPLPHLRTVRDFHGQLFKDELKEIVQRQGVNIGGFFSVPEHEKACDVGGVESFEVPVMPRAPRAA